MSLSELCVVRYTYEYNVKCESFWLLIFQFTYVLISTYVT